MSWKSIEMQVALPRAQDAGKLQDQMMKQGQQFQESLAQSQIKQEELKRKKVNESEEIKKARIKKESDDPNQNKEEQSQEEELSHTIEHPYLGNKIDFNG